MLTTTPANAEERYSDVAGMSYLAFDQYLREVAWIEPLSFEEQERLLERVARSQRVPENAHYALLARDARDCLVEQYQPLVFQMAKRWVRFSGGMEVLDLVNEGSLGVIHAIEQYPRYPNFHGHFALLARCCVRNALIQACSSQQLVVLPPWVRRLLPQIRKASSRYERTSGLVPSSAQLASLLGVSEDKILEAEYLAARCSVESLEALSYDGEQVEESHGFVSLFEASVMVENERQAALKVLFEQVLEHVLTPCERQVVQVRYGLGDRGNVKTVQETAQELAMRTDTVNSLCRRAASRLRETLEPLVSSAEGIEVVRAHCEEHYTVNQAAARLQVTPDTIRKYIAQGRLPAQRAESRAGGMVHWWQLPKEAVEALLAARSQDSEEHYTVEQAAVRLQVSPATVRYYMAQGRLPAHQGTSRSGGSIRRWQWMLSKEAVEELRATRAQDGEEVAV